MDHNKLNLAATKEELLDVLRIVITTINVMTAKPLVFDNTMMHTEAKQILPSIVYPIYCFPWIGIEDGMLAWDGSLLSNTLIREVLYVSLKNDKKNLYYQIIRGKITQLLSNIAEVESRAKTYCLVTKMKTR